MQNFDRICKLYFLGVDINIPVHHLKFMKALHQLYEKNTTLIKEDDYSPVYLSDGEHIFAEFDSLSANFKFFFDSSFLHPFYCKKDYNNYFDDMDNEIKRILNIFTLKFFELPAYSITFLPQSYFKKIDRDMKNINNPQED